MVLETVTLIRNSSGNGYVKVKVCIRAVVVVMLLVAIVIARVKVTIISTLNVILTCNSENKVAAQVTRLAIAVEVATVMITIIIITIF